MALAEDAATVLEQFVHDVANLPAEIAHLLEEIQAKDQIMQECRLYINKQDRILQKHVKDHGGHVMHPKDEQMQKAVLVKYDEAQALQEQKNLLSEKACFLLDRHVKRLDLKIRDLQNDGAMLLDPQMPSLLRQSVGNLVDPVSGTGTGYSTPNPLAANHTHNSNNIAKAAVARMIGNANTSHRSASAAPAATMQTQLPQRQRETSLGAVSDGKRRRLNATLNLSNIPAASSNLRQSSLGPSGTPKVGTPGSRAGSAGPRTKKPTKKLAPHQLQAARKKAAKNGISTKSRRRLIGGVKASPSSTGDEDSHTGSGSEDDNDARTQDGAGDEDDAEDGGYDEEAEDTTLYCTCHSVSRGNMVACDNENCPYEWFHWDCVGLTEEPVGRWLCPHCVKLPKSQLKVVKG